MMLHYRDQNSALVLSDNLPQKQVKSSWDWSGLSVSMITLIILLSLALPAWANIFQIRTSLNVTRDLLFIPIIPITNLLNFLTGYYGFNLIHIGLIVGIIISESFILKIKQSVSWKKGLLIVMIGNFWGSILFSVIMMMTLTVNFHGFSVNLSFNPLTTLMASVLLASMYFYLARLSKLFQKIGKKKSIFCTYLVFTGVSLFPGFAVNLFERLNNNNPILYLMTIAVIFMGFLNHFVVKGFLYSLFFQRQDSDLSSTFMTMEITSMPLVMISFLLSY